MNSLEELSKRCLSVCQVPEDINRDYLLNHVKSQFKKGDILDNDQVTGIETGKNLTRFVLLCSSLEDVDHMCKEVREEEITFEERSFVVKYQLSIACELPDRWENFEIPGADSESQPHQQQTGPLVPHRQPKSLGVNQTSQQYAYAPGPYGAVSGFYHNIHGSDNPNMNQGGGMHPNMHGQFPGQPSLPGGEQHQGQGLAGQGQGPYQGLGPQPGQQMYGHFPAQQPIPGNEQDQGHGPNQGQSGQGHGQPGQGQQGQGMNFPFGPVGPGQFPPGFNPNFPYQMFGPGAPNMPMMQPRMMFNPRTGQMIPMFAPSPYNEVQTAVKVPVDGQNAGEGSQAVADQNAEMEKLHAKIDKERRSMHHQEDTYEEPAGLDSGSGQQFEEEVPEERPAKIVISDLPSDINDEFIEMFFENKRMFKGCNVSSVEIVEDEAYAIVEFEDPDAVDMVLSKCPLKMNRTDVNISVYQPPQQDVEDEFSSMEPVNREQLEQGEPDEKPTAIVVYNLPSTAHDEYLQMFFENKRKFTGCNVYSVEVNEEEASAVIEFEEPESVDIVLSKCPLKMMGKEVEIAIYRPPPPVLLTTVEVTGPCSVVHEDHFEMLEMYFENKKRSGGDDIESMKFDAGNNMVLITFESEEVAQRVVDRGKHVIKGENLRVQLHVPSNKPGKASKGADDNEQEPEPEPPNMIKVKGVDKSASRDTLEFYFENSRRSGGGEIESIKSDDEDEDVVYITFKEPQVAEKVAKKSHKLEGNSLNVTLYTPPVPPPSYENKILIKGLQASTTQDCLFNFIEAKSGCIPETMDYHSEQEEVVMVTFSEDPDFKKLEEAFNKYKLEDVSLKIYPVPISNCIIVANLASDVTKDTVEYYFENKRKSGGGQVEKVVMNDDETCLVYFADYNVIDEVLEKKHTLSKQLLDVKRYQECLGRPEGEIAEQELRLPDDLELKKVDSQKLKFMKHSDTNRTAIEKQLEDCHARIIWPNEGEKVILTCTLTKEVKDCFKLKKQWKNNAEQNFNDFMKLILVKKVPVLQDIWSKVMDELKTFHIDNPGAVAIFVDQKEGVITVVGNQKVAENLSVKIEDMTKKVMTEAEKEREKIKESITTLKPIETKMLLADKFPVEMEKLFPDLKVKINQNKNEILFEGPLGQVRDAKLKMYEYKGNFARDSSLKVSNLLGGMILLKQTKEHIVKKLKNAHVTAVWDITDYGCLEVICASEDQIQLCVNVIRSAVVEHSLALKKPYKTVVTSEKWQTKVDELHGYHPGKCMIKVADDVSKVNVCGTDDIADDILDNIKKFLRLNTVMEIKVPCTKNVHRLIERHHKHEVANIAKDLTNHNVQIVSVSDYGGFEVRGTEDGLNEAKHRLSQLLQKVRQREHIVKKPGLASHMQTVKGKDNLNTIENMQPCVVAVKGDNDEDDDNPYESVPFDSGVRDNIGVKGVKIVAFCKVYECRNVYTMQGDMTELTVDMLVNSADDKLSLTGGLGKAIVQKGGKTIQKECTDYINDNDRLDDGDAFVSSAGKLKAGSIVHVRGPVWRGGMRKEDEMLEEAVFKCLTQASHRSLTSVAMPAISCGTYGFPVRKATTIIVAAVKNFFREFQDSSVMEIYLCDMKSNTVDAFNEALTKDFGAMSVQKFVSPDSFRPPSKRFSGGSSDEEEIRPMDTDEETDYDYQTVKRPPVPMSGRPSLSGTQIGNIAVSVVKGEIAKQRVDVIVNTTAKNLDLKNGAVSASLLKTGGPELQVEVSKKYPSGIKDGEIAVTLGQKLSCDMVVHSSMTNWDGKKDAQCKQALHRLMKDCMDEAERQNKRSIAFPAIGTGNLGFPKDVVATEMFSAVSNFTKKNPSSGVTDVRFIVYQKDFPTIQAFENEVKRWTSGKQGAAGGRQDRIYSAYQDLQYRQGGGASGGHDSDDIDEEEENPYETLPDYNDGDGGDVVDGSDEGNGAYKIGSIKVTVQQGDITAQNTMCIVNSSNDTLDLSRGNVSQAILKKGGKMLQKEVDAKRKKMKTEQVVVTSAPGMDCQHIIHVVAKDTIPEWKDILEKCLYTAENHKMKSIAFPALGTGIQLEASEIAATMAKAILNFANTNPKYVEEIRLVIYQQKMVIDFQTAILKTIQPGESLGSRLYKGFTGLFSGGNGDQKTRPKTRQRTQKKPTKKQDPNTVTFVILAMSEDIIGKAIQRLESCLNNEIMSTPFKDSIIKSMSDQQIREIQAIANKHHLELKVDTAKGHIQVTGIAANVSKVSGNIHKILRVAVTIEQERKTAELMSNLTQWSYISNEKTGQEIKNYEKELNYKIESAYISKADNVKFTAGNITYILDFQKMEEYPEDDASDSVTVIRRDLIKQGAFEQPALWTDMTGNLRVVVLQSTCQEYTDIAQKFTASAGAGFTVVKIERIQNKTLWSQYQAKKKQLDDQNPPNTTNERLLWHGTAVEAVDNINAHGFNRSYCGKNATVYGDGVYYAVNASYSCSNTYSRPDSSGLKRVYYCRVLTGEYTQGVRGMRVAPAKGGANSTALYDSVVDRPVAPGMFIIFHDTQAYPEYLISVKPP